MCRWWSLPDGFRMDSINYVIKGLCPECAEGGEGKEGLLKAGTA